jgi:hypothetical protein
VNQYWPTQAVPQNQNVELVRHSWQLNCLVMRRSRLRGTKPRFLTAAFLSDACYFAYAAISTCIRSSNPPFPKLHIGYVGCSFLITLVGRELRQPLEASEYKLVPAVFLTVFINQVTEDLIDFATSFDGVRIRACCFCSQSHNRQGLRLALGDLRSIRKRHNSHLSTLGSLCNTYAAAGQHYFAVTMTGKVTNKSLSPSPLLT